MGYRSQKGQTTIILLAVVFIFAFLLIGGLGDPTHHTILSPDDPNQLKAQQENGGLFGKFENMLGFGPGDVSAPITTPTPTPILVPGASITPSPTPTGTTEYPPRPIKFFWDEPTGTYTNPQVNGSNSQSTSLQMKYLNFSSVPIVHSPPVPLTPPAKQPPVVYEPPPPVVTAPPKNNSNPKQNQPGQKCIHYQMISNGCTCSSTGSYTVTCQTQSDGSAINVRNDTYPPSLYTSDWCEGNKNNGNPDGTYCIGKPVIYLYPDYPMAVDVKVVTIGEIIESIPHYPQEGWLGIMANPNGTFLYKGKAYRELYYESNVKDINPPETGIIIDKRDLIPTLSGVVLKLGLNTYERNEFLDYWIPRLNKLDAPYILFSVLSMKEKQRVDSVYIDPKPDTMIEFIAYFKPLSEKMQIKPLRFPAYPQKRLGFTAVEWGGVIDNN